MIEIKGKFTIHYNGELIAECENLVFKPYCHEETLSMEFGDAEHEQPKEPESTN